MIYHLSSLLGDRRIADLLDTPADMAAMLAFEQALAEAQAELGMVDVSAASAVIAALKGLTPDLDALRAATERDGVVVPELLRQVRAGLAAEYHSALHFGATSQDAIDTAFALKLKPVFTTFRERLVETIAALLTLQTRFGTPPLMGRTRMQAAIAISAGDRIANWTGPLERRLAELPQVEAAISTVVLFGAAGTSEKLAGKGDILRQRLAEKLGLNAPGYVTHSQRDAQVQLGNWLAMTTGSLGKIGQDIALMAENERAEISLSGTGGSSAMPHKQNPVLAEILVTLARYNATQTSGLQQVLLHEQERSGSAWSLEWMILPAMIKTTGTALRHATTLLQSVRSIGQKI